MKIEGCGDDYQKRGFVIERGSFLLDLSGREICLGFFNSDRLSLSASLRVVALSFFYSGNSLSEMKQFLLVESSGKNKAPSRQENEALWLSDVMA